MRNVRSSLSMTLVGSLLGLFSLALTPPAAATVVPTFSLASLTHEADSIVRGVVVDEEVLYDPRFRRVYTHSVVQVLERLSGEAHVGDLVVVRQIGGVLDGIETRVVGTAALLPGDEVLLFARTDGAFHYVVGLAQGLFHVERPPDRAPVVSRASQALRLMVPRLPTAAPPPPRQSLGSMRAAIARVLATREGR